MPEAVKVVYLPFFFFAHVVGRTWLPSLTFFDPLFHPFYDLLMENSIASFAFERTKNRNFLLLLYVYLYGWKTLSTGAHPSAVRRRTGEGRFLEERNRKKKILFLPGVAKCKQRGDSSPTRDNIN